MVCAPSAEKGRTWSNSCRIIRNIGPSSVFKYSHPLYEGLNLKLHRRKPPRTEILSPREEIRWIKKASPLCLPGWYFVVLIEGQFSLISLRLWERDLIQDRVFFSVFFCFVFSGPILVYKRPAGLV